MAPVRDEVVGGRVPLPGETALTVAVMDTVPVAVSGSGSCASLACGSGS